LITSFGREILGILLVESFEIDVGDSWKLPTVFTGMKVLLQKASSYTGENSSFSFASSFEIDFGHSGKLPTVFTDIKARL
jgi:hypothetical protein